MQHLFKNQLQTYAQKRNLALPVYSCERVGPPHASRFKCEVTVNGQIYESEEYFPTLNKAEHAAAQAALMTLLPDGVEQVSTLNKLLCPFVIISLCTFINLAVVHDIFCLYLFGYKITLCYLVFIFFLG